MNPVGTTFFFYLLAFFAIVSAIAVITRRNPVHAALSLIVTLLSLAGFYLMLYAPFVASVRSCSTPAESWCCSSSSSCW